MGNKEPFKQPSSIWLTAWRGLEKPRVACSYFGAHVSDMQFAETLWRILGKLRSHRRRLLGFQA